MTEEFDWIGDRTQRRNERNLRRAEEKRRIRAQRRLKRKQAVENINQGLEQLQERLGPVFQQNVKFNKGVERFRALSWAEYSQLKEARSQLLAKGRSFKPVKLRPYFKGFAMKLWLQNIWRRMRALPWRQATDSLRQKSSTLMVGAKGLIGERKWQSHIPVYWIIGVVPVARFIIDLVSFVGILCGLGAVFSFVDNGLSRENIIAFVFAAVSIVWFVCTRIRVKFSLRSATDKAYE